MQYSFSLGDGHGAVYWIYSYLAFDFLAILGELSTSLTDTGAVLSGLSAETQQS